MSDLTGDRGGDMSGLGGAMPDPTARPQRPQAPRGNYGGGNSGGGAGGRYATDLHSVTIHARQRTFYIDLKESANGKFLKISEKSRGGQKTTIMFDAEDLDQIIGALGEMKAKLS